uniref:Uncharacterized protein n=1 Tax=Peronospora matthiolae TaxID=2874970 RepID=A0AAV1V7E8_9STRA
MLFNLTFNFSATVSVPAPGFGIGTAESTGIDNGVEQLPE